MKRIFAIVGIAILLITAFPAAAFAGEKGSGCPPGAHETINIIGVPHEMNDNFNGGNGSRIFVDREENTTFYVYGGIGTGFEIKDHDGTDGEVGQAGRGYENAGIVLPYGDGKWQVKVYVKLLGPMDSSAKWRSEYFDGANWMPIDEFTMTREDKKFILRNAWMLKDGYQDVIWYLEDKTNFRHCQLRIYVNPGY